MRLFLFVLTITMFLFSCKGNRIHYDEVQKSVICTEGVIKHLTITNQVFYDSYFIDLNQNNIGSNIFYLFRKNEGYKISTFTRHIIDSIKIAPNVKYLIKNRSYPDASNLGFEIEFDSLYNVKYLEYGH